MKAKDPKDDRAIKFGERVRKVRKILKLNQKEFADRIGMANNYLSEIESGNVKPGFEFFYKVSKTFNINAFHLLHGVEPAFLPKNGQLTADDANRTKTAELKFAENDDRIMEMLSIMKESNIVYLSVLGYFSKWILENNDLIKKDISISREKHQGK